MIGNDKQLYAVDEVADLLGLHVKTVRGYVRAGKLPATRVGKSYRIAAADLAEFTGQPPTLPARETVRRVRRVEATTIVQVDAVGPETVRRIAAMVGAAAGTEDCEPLRVQTIYDEERAELKVILFGGPNRVGAALRLLAMVLEDE
ncbi:helix-turn-helix domain-containing protein [Micromonospora sp. ATCC 39149]|uniref:helix-turn-helix domain-containing protein n=1 Tax=Micromonospora sp. (strain ATCC 39149 / NRRL 15099 / SCC 1413) TaxID=219305 RepID=UPI001E2C03A4|nr:helix-turn-helix domain-containing protein [Micromonospora sp. ATCC 39149]